MINRRHLRIKVLQALYAYLQDENPDYVKHEKLLLQNVERMFDLYVYLLLTFNEMKLIAENKIEEAKNKLQPTREDLNPNMKFVNNRIFSIIDELPELRRESQNRKVNWNTDIKREIFRKTFNQAKESECYVLYMNAEEDSFDADKAFAIAFFKENIANSPFLLTYFEEENIHWLDDIDLMCAMVIKTIKAFKEEEDAQNKLLNFYTDDKEEIDFMKSLFRKSIQDYDDNLVMIDELAKNWEIDRIAKMDLLLMSMSITEMKAFPTIPLNVSLNEYIEISKYYSTPKSNTFINGILDKAIARLQQDGKVNKEGRGLVNTKLN
jgi:transcription antitermination protein NusB